MAPDHEDREEADGGRSEAERDDGTGQTEGARNGAPDAPVETDALTVGGDEPEPEWHETPTPPLVDPGAAPVAVEPEAACTGEVWEWQPDPGERATEPAEEIDAESAPAVMATARSTGSSRRPPPQVSRPVPPRRRRPAAGPTGGAGRARPSRAGRVGQATAPAAARGRRQVVIALTVLSLVVVALGVTGVLLSRKGTKQASAPPTTSVPTSTVVTLPDAAFVTYNDPETNFSIRYPRSWHRLEAPVKEMRLIVSDEKQYSASVRVIRTDQATTPANLANIKAVADGVVGPDVQMLKQDTVTINGLIGFRYIYTFTDSKSGLTGAHLHYFLFQGHKMNSIVFEALPTGDFAQIEGVFDQMLQSFHSEPEAAPPSTTG